MSSSLPCAVVAAGAGRKAEGTGALAEAFAEGVVDAAGRGGGLCDTSGETCGEGTIGGDDAVARALMLVAIAVAMAVAVSPGGGAKAVGVAGAAAEESSALDATVARGAISCGEVRIIFGNAKPAPAAAAAIPAISHQRPREPLGGPSA
jgi:hypothetical protein